MITLDRVRALVARPVGAVLDYIRADLAADVDALAIERDDLAEQLRRAGQRMADSRRHWRAAVAQAYEPERDGVCVKVRYHREADALQHAIRIAVLSPGQTFHTYRCDRCPPYPGLGYDARPFHVGHTWPLAYGSLWVEGEFLNYACGCAFGLITRDPVTHCPTHSPTTEENRS